MDFLFSVVLLLSVFTVILILFYFIYTKRKSFKIKKQLKEIDNESKLLAIDDLRRILKRDTQNIDAREKLADLLLDNKSYLAAIKEYLVLLDHFSGSSAVDDLKYYNKIGDAYFKLGNLEDAKKYFLIVKTKDDINFEANANLAEIEMQMGQFDKAENYFNIANKIAPENMGVLKQLGICQFKLNRNKEAIDKFLIYIKDRPNDLEIVNLLAYGYFNLSRQEEALKFFSKLKLEPEYSPDAYFHIGLIHKSQKLYVQAIDDFNNSLVAGSLDDTQKLAELHYLLADCYLKSHNIQKAVEHWKKCNDFIPNYKDISSKLDNFSQVNSNQLLETYLVGSINQFTNICKLIVKYYITHFSSLKGSVKFIDIKTNQDSSLQIIAEVSSGGFVEQNFFVFMRSATTVGDMAMRNLYNKLKDQKADKGICITAGNFSESAKEFVETRMLKIIKREELITILNEISKKLNN